VRIVSFSQLLPREIKKNCEEDLVLNKEEENNSPKWADISDHMESIIRNR